MNEQSNHRSTSAYLTVSDLAYLVGTTQRVVERLVSFELIQPARTEPGPLFHPDQTSRVKKYMRLHAQLGVSWSSMELVVRLLNRIEELEKEVERLRDGLDE